MILRGRGIGMSALGAFPGEILAYKRQGLPLESSRGTGRGFAYAAAQNDECVRDSEWNAKRSLQ